MTESRLEPGFDNEGQGDTSTASDASLSILGSLKERRATIIEQAFFDRRVPRWESPEIYVRFKPVDHKIIRRAIDQTETKSKGDKKAAQELQANIDVLIHGCVGVYAVLDGNREQKFSLRAGDPRGEWTRFDPNLADNLGIEAGSATEVVRALYITDGDILTTAGMIAEFSGYRNESADEAIEGE